MPDEQYKLRLDISDILSGLVKVDKETLDTAKRIEAHFKKAGKSIDGLFIDINGRVREANGRFSAMGNEAANGFKSVGGSAKASGLEIGAVAGAVSALTHEIINLGKQAVRIFAEIVADSINLAAVFEANKGLIKNIFEGDEKAAGAVIDRIIKKSAEIGLLPETGVSLGVSFLPDIGSIEQLDKFIEGAVKLKQLAPEKSFEDIRQALEQAISGDVRPFVDRLNLPLEAGKRIKELQKEFGNVEGTLKGLDELFLKFGVDLEDISETAIGKFGQLQSKLQELQLVGGEQALESIKPLLEDLVTFLKENREELILFAASLGNSVGSVVEFVQSLSGLTDIESGDIEKLGQDIFRVVEQIKLGSEIVGGFLGVVYELFAALDPLRGIFEVLGIEVGSFFAQFGEGQGAVIGFLNLMAQSKAGLEGILAILQAGIESAGLAVESIKALASGDLEKANELRIASNETLAGALTEGQAAIRASYDESKKAIDEYTQAIDDQKKSQDDLKDSLGQTNEAGLAAADAFTKQRQAAKDLAAANVELEAAQTKVDKAMADAAKDRDRKFEDIDISFERKKLDIIKEFADKRLDASRENRRKVDDLRRHEGQDEIKAELDLDRKEADIASKFAREVIDEEADQRQKRVEIEENFRQKIEDIDKQSSFDLDEAERNRDAVSFLRIIRQRGQQVSQAQTDRQREIDELAITGGLRKAELKTQQDRELADAQLANRRKIDDLRTSLQLAIDDQNIAYKRQTDDININERRKNDEAKLARDRDRDDAKLAYDRKLADLQESLAAELALLAEFGAKKLALLAEIAAAEAAIDSKPRSRQKTVEGAEDAASSRQGSINQQRQRATYASSRQGSINTGRQAGRQFGGSVMAGQPYVVGERQPELFIPDVPGRIMPNLNGMAGQTVNNTNSKNINLSVPADRLSPGQRMEARQLALEVLDGVS